MGGMGLPNVIRCCSPVGRLQRTRLGSAVVPRHIGWPTESPRSGLHWRATTSRAPHAGPFWIGPTTESQPANGWPPLPSNAVSVPPRARGRLPVSSGLPPRGPVSSPPAAGSSGPSAVASRCSRSPKPRRLPAPRCNRRAHGSPLLSLEACGVAAPAARWTVGEARAPSKSRIADVGSGEGRLA